MRISKKLKVLALAGFLACGGMLSSAHGQGIIIHLLLDDGSYYSIPPEAGGWTFDALTCMDYRNEDGSDPCNPITSTEVPVLYFGDSGFGLCDTTAPCDYVGLAGGSAFTTAIDLRDFAPGTPIRFYPAYGLRTDGSGGDVFEMFCRVNLEGEVFQKIASNIDPDVTQLFDFGTETIEPITLPANAAGNEVNIQFLASPDGVVGPVGGPTGMSVGSLEFVGTAAPGAGTDPDTTTAPNEWYLVSSGSSIQGWTQVTAGASPLNPTSPGFYFGNPATDNYADRDPDSLFAGPVDFTDVADPVVLTFTYAFQTDDSPAEDVAVISINIGNSSTFTSIASSAPGSGLPLLQNDGLQHVLQITLPAGTGGNFANLRASFTPDGDATSGEGLFIAQTFSFSGADPGSGGGGGDGDGGGGGGGGSACFIATAAYGTPLSADIDALREVRDTYLMDNAAGLVFVDAYYQIAPGLADSVAAHPALAALVRTLLIPVVMLCNVLVQSPSLLVALVLLSGTLACMRRRALARARR